MKIYNGKNKYIILGFGAFDGTEFKSTRKIPNYTEFESNTSIIIGKIKSNIHPMYKNKSAVYYIFFCFRICIVDK